jgi:thiamine-phosphate diphosphorylase
MTAPNSTAFSLPPVYPITNWELSGLPHSEQVEQLLNAGAEFIQIRDKRLNSRELLFEAKAAVRLAHERGAKIIVNDRVDIARIAGADGVHLGQDDLPPDAARALLGPGSIIGFSTHSLEQAANAARLPIDYVAFGPIYRTSTKESADDPVGLELLKRVREMVHPLPLVAIGGIGRVNAKNVINAGADSLAIISDIAGDPNGVASGYRSILSSLNA